MNYPEVLNILTNKYVITKYNGGDFDDMAGEKYALFDIHRTSWRYTPNYVVSDHFVAGAFERGEWDFYLELDKLEYNLLALVADMCYASVHYDAYKSHKLYNAVQEKLPFAKTDEQKQSVLQEVFQVQNWRSIPVKSPNGKIHVRIEVTFDGTYERAFCHLGSRKVKLTITQPQSSYISDIAKAVIRVEKSLAILEQCITDEPDEIILSMIGLMGGLTYRLETSSKND